MNSTANRPKIAIVCALKEEFAAVEAGLGKEHRAGFELIRAGVGPVSAAKVARDLAEREQPPELIVSTGFCGGLSDDVRVGDVVFGCESVFENVRFDGEMGCRAMRESRILTRNPDGALVAKIQDAVCVCSTRCVLGKMAGANAAVFSTGDKRQLGERTQALAVDMETHSLVVASAERTRVIFVRAVSDAVSDELPAEVGEFLNENGNLRIGKIARFLFKKPSNIKRLMELKKRSDAAGKALTDVWRTLSGVL